MPVGLNTIDCLLILFRGRGHDVICIDGSSDITNDYVEKLFKRSTRSIDLETPEEFQEPGSLPLVQALKLLRLLGGAVLVSLNSLLQGTRAAIVEKRIAIR